MKYEYKNPLSITSQFSFCGMPFRLDTYSGCSFLCTYCYSLRRGGNSNYQNIKIADPDLIINRFKNAFEKPLITTGLISQYIRRRMPIHFGGMSDPFQKVEEIARVSLKVLEYLCLINYPIVISTKSILLADKNYIDALRSNPNVIVQYSFSTLEDSISKEIEPNCSLPQARLDALKLLSEYGIKTTIRWQPYILGLSETPNAFVEKIANSGISHLIIEFLKLPIDNKKSWNESMKPFIKIREHYIRVKAEVHGRELILPPELKIEIIKSLKLELANHGITLGVGDNELQYLSETDCCCGIDTFNGFENWNKYQFTYAISNSTNNKISFKDIHNQWRPSGAIDKHLNSKSRIRNRNSPTNVSHYIEARWENLNSDFNPSKYFGITDSGFRDERGFRIFEFKKNMINKI